MSLSTPPTYKHIFLFWLPLAATWLMMSIEGPFLAAIIARLPDPKFNLAAYGVAFSFALIIEAPVIMMMSASTALVKNITSFHKLKKFTYAMNFALTGIMLVFIIPPIFYFITETLIGLPNEVAELTHWAVILLLPWPGMIGYRRFYQGILIRYNLTRRVAYGTIIRLTVMGLTALMLYLFTSVEGVIVGAISLTAAVTAEGIASKLMANNILKNLPSENEKISYRDIYNFYYPLALTSLIALAVHPFVTFFIGQSRLAIESLAVLPVLNSFIFIFRSIGLSFQEVGIALIGNKKEGLIPLRNFAFALSIIVFILLSIISFTPLAEIWFGTISGLSAELTQLAELPLKIMILVPVGSVILSWQRSILVDARKTKAITFGTVAEFAGIVIVLFILIYLFDFVGIVAATSAFLAGRICSNLLLMKPALEIIGGIRREKTR